MANESKKPTKKQNTVQFNAPVNLGIVEKAQKILDDPENYKPEGSPFNFNSKSGVYSQAILIGLQWMLDHPKQAPATNEANLFAQAVADCLFPKLDARLSTLNETTIANYLNTRSTNLYAKNILAALIEKLGAGVGNISMTKLLAGVNKNIDFIVDYEKSQLLGGKSPLADTNSIAKSPKEKPTKKDK